MRVAALLGSTCARPTAACMGVCLVRVPGHRIPRSFRCQSHSRPTTSSLPPTLTTASSPSFSSSASASAMRWCGALTAAAAAAALGSADAAATTAGLAALPALGLNSSYVTVSGLSSGGYMAVQMHFAYSRTFTGAGVFAAGPYFCAGLPPTSVGVAQTACMTTPSLISVDALTQITRNTAATGTIDPLANLADDRVFVYSGSEDTVVHSGVVEKLAHFYGEFVSTPNRVAQVYDVASEHSMPTQSYGNQCSYLGEPYINDCQYDGVGAMLQHLFDNTLTAPPADQLNSTGQGEFRLFSQKEFLVVPWTLELASMYSSGVVYVPPRCAPGAKKAGEAPCRLHVAYHGCKQTIPMVGSQYYLHAGYAAWADANDLVVLFPQVTTNTGNPNGCWDWWGFTGTDYASKLGIQMFMSKKMVDRLLSTGGGDAEADGTLLPSPPSKAVLGSVRK